jgi:hypothetical protein
LDIGDFLRSIGGLAGIAALAWRAVDEFSSYLRISLKIEGPKDGWITLLTTVENRGGRKKDLSWAFLLIGPECENPIDTGNILFKECGENILFKECGEEIVLESTNDFFLYSNRIHNRLSSGHRFLIPLTFYYSENIAIGDETLTYRYPLCIDHVPKHTPLSARFFVAGRNRLHRSTHDCTIRT